MAQHFLREIEALKQKLLGLSAMVEERIAKAIDSVVKHDSVLALSKLSRGDNDIDQMEVEVEEDCLKLLALYQPVAVDLRFVVAVLKINNDLERMADKAVNIARRAEYLAQHPRQTLPSSLTAMAREVELMVRHSLDALVQGRHHAGSSGVRRRPGGGPLQPRNSPRNPGPDSLAPGRR